MNEGKGGGGGELKSERKGFSPSSPGGKRCFQISKEEKGCVSS